MGSNHSEKRDFMRMHMNTNAIITDKEGEKHKCLCVDLSAAGVLIEINDNIEVGEKVQLDVPSKLNNFEALSALCTILRAKKEDSIFKMALSIDEIK
jgi:hypothetical protein